MTWRPPEWTKRALLLPLAILVAAIASVVISLLAFVGLLQTYWRATPARARER